MNARSYLMFLEDILESIGKIEAYIGDMEYDTFIDDGKTVDAVVRNLEIIGEASNKLPDEIKNLKSLNVLELANNKFSIKEQLKIKKSLPKCDT